VSFLELPSICDDIPFRSLNIDKLNIPSHLMLADPKFNQCAEIDMLLGCALYYELLCAGQIKLGPNFPVLQETLPGWIVAGSIQIVLYQISVAILFKLIVFSVKILQLSI